MTQNEIVILVVVAILLVIVAVASARNQARSRELQHAYGPEYEKVVDDTGDRKRAEQILEARAERVRRLDIRPLQQEDQDRYSRRWQQVESRFVEQPTVAISDAQWLLEEVMRLRGYTHADIAQQEEDLSVRYPDLLPDFRNARAIADASETGRASTEDMRQAMVHYKKLFSAMLGGTTARS